jgi:drug/metabolite transporter (DMT)-like permease
MLKLDFIPAHAEIPTVMPVSVLLFVLFGALLHSSWNLLLKLGRNTHVAAANVFIGAGALAAVALPFLPAPAPASWPYLAVSAVAQLIYGMLLATAYRTGDLSHTYPLMRGTAPLLVAFGSFALVGERLSGLGWIGVSLISGGILMLIFDARFRGQSAAATRFALLTAFTIAAYTTIDGAGVRVSGHAIAYAFWSIFLTGVPWLIWMGVRGRVDRWAQLRRQLPGGIVGGACSIASYAIALWAMTRAPVAAVAAIRETSIVFGMALGALVLHERVTWIRALAALAVTLGVCVMRTG